MAKFPYLVYGTTSPALNTYPITVYNITKNSKLTKLTNVSGQYVVDLANMDSDYTTGDSFRIYVQHGGYFGNTDWTFSGEGGVNQDLTIYGGIDISTLRTDVWDIIFRTFQTGTYAIDTDNIHGAMNKTLISDEGYPQVVIYPPAFETTALDFKKELHEKKVNVMIEIYHNAHATLKVLTDEIEDKLWLAEKEGYWNNFNLFNLDMPDNDYDWWEENKKTIHRATLNANFMYLGRR